MLTVKLVGAATTGADEMVGRSDNAVGDNVGVGQNPQVKSQYLMTNDRRGENH